MKRKDFATLVSRVPTHTESRRRLKKRRRCRRSILIYYNTRTAFPARPSHTHVIIIIIFFPFVSCRTSYRFGGKKRAFIYKTCPTLSPGTILYHRTAALILRIPPILFFFLIFFFFY